MFLQRFGVSLVLFAALTACEGEKDIVHSLTEFEANEIMVVLETQKIEANKMKEDGRVVTWAVLVPASQRQEALRVLVANKLPKQRSSGLAEVYPAGSGGLIPTKSEEKAKFLMAIQGEIEGMLKSFPGIQDARVAIVIPEKDVVRDLETPPPPATASVGLVFNPDGGAPPVSEERVKALVAAAVEDLKPVNVQVVMKENRPPLLVGTSGVPTTANGEKIEPLMNIKVSDADSRKRLMGFIAMFGTAAAIGLFAGIFGLVQWMRFRSKFTKSDAELTAMRKARSV